MIKQNKFYIFAGGFLFIIVVLLPFNYLLHFALDDSFFYIKTAFNFASGHGSTFDGINLTNGYQPLWFLILSAAYLPLTLIKGISPEFIYRYTFELVIIINLFTLKILREFIRLTFKDNGSDIMVLISLLILPLVLLNIIGMETQIALLLISMYLYSYTHSIMFNKTNSFNRSIITGLIILARIDYIVFLLPFIVLGEFKRLKDFNYAEKLKSIIKFLIVPFILECGYSLINYYYFGTIYSISGYLKVSTRDILFLRNLPYPYLQPINFIILTFIIVSGLLYFILFRRKINNEITRSVFIIIELFYLGGALFLIANYCFNIYGCAEWYYSTASFAGVLLLSPIVRYSKKLKLFMFGTAFIIFICYFTIFRINYYRWDEIYDYAKSLKNIILQNEIVYQFNICGIIGFFSERKVINGDGLINSFKYFEFVKSGKLNEYLKSVGADYYGTDSFSDLTGQGSFVDKRGEYLFQFPLEKIKLKKVYRYGGIFRNKNGYLYLIRIIP